MTAIPEQPKVFTQKETLESAIVTRALAIVFSDKLLENKENKQLYSFRLKKLTNELCEELSTITNGIYSQMPEDSMLEYIELADNLVKDINEIADIRFMDDGTADLPIEGRIYSILYLGKLKVAEFGNGVFWIPRNPIGIHPDKTEIKGIISL